MTDWSTITMHPSEVKHPRLPPPPADRLQLARKPTSTDADPNLYHSILSQHHQQPSSNLEDNDDKDFEKTVLYLAYGSNLSFEKFRGDRGINPLSQVNVYVPALRLTFDLAGIPYLEPCFSGTQYRSTTKDRNDASKTTTERYRDVVDEKATIDTSEDVDLESGDQGHGGYRKDQWHKPLIGVVYEVTLTDYAHIIATEGGGNGYVDIVTECFPFPGADDDNEYNPNDPTPDAPSGKPFMAHTLLSPPKSAHGPKSHVVRPDPSYAQPSARYLKLIMDGAEELNFPYDYRAYLASIRPYRVTTSGQKVGQWIAVYILIPLLQIFIVLGELFADEDGIIPAWLQAVFNAMRELMWMVYDVVGVKVLGDGERSVDDT